MVRSRVRIVALLALLVAGGMYAFLLAASSGGTGPTISGKYLLLFDDRDCELGGANPPESGDCSAWKLSRVHIMQSDDGLEWESLDGFAPFPGYAPDAVRRGNTLYIYSNVLLTGTSTTRGRVGLQLHKVDLDSGRWDGPIDVAVRGGRGPFMSWWPGKDFPVEVSAILDKDNALVLFYRVWHDGAEQVEYIRSATEVPGRDGTSFTVDEGDRFALETGPGSGADFVANPEILRGSDGLVLLLGTGGATGNSILALTASELRGAYSPVAGLDDGVLLDASTSATGYYEPETGVFWTYSLPAIGKPADHVLHSRHLSIGRQLKLGTACFDTLIELEDVPGSEQTFFDDWRGGLGNLSFAVNANESSTWDVAGPSEPSITGKYLLVFNDRDCELPGIKVPSEEEEALSGNQGAWLRGSLVCTSCSPMMGQLGGPFPGSNPMQVGTPTVCVGVIRSTSMQTSRTRVSGVSVSSSTALTLTRGLGRNT